MYNSKQEKGIHILYDMKGVNLSAENRDIKTIENYCSDSVKKVKLTEVGKIFTKINDRDIIGATILSESHLSIHISLATHKANIDVFVCNVTNNNIEKARELSILLKNYLNPTFSTYKEIYRE